MTCKDLSSLYDVSKLSDFYKLARMIVMVIKFSQSIEVLDI